MSAPAIPGEVTETSLDLPHTITFEDAQATGETLIRMHESACWWLGDWFNFVQEYFPETWPQMVEANEYQYSTLKKWGWICRKVPRGTRDARLSPRHHEIVASLSEDEQRAYLRESAPEEGSTTPRLSTRELSERVRGPQGNVETVEMVGCPKCGEVYPMREANTYLEAAE